VTVGDRLNTARGRGSPRGRDAAPPWLIGRLWIPIATIRTTFESVTPREHDVEAGGIRLRVREAGDPGGETVIHFHGTPGCRLELAFADDMVKAAGVRIIAFDRPGYGGSTQTPFGLASVAGMAIQVADHFGVDQFRTTGWSGGGPFALATAALAGARVPTVGVIAGAGPFQLVPGLLDNLSDGDKAAVKLLPDQQAAYEGFVEGFDLEPALKDATTLYQEFEPMLSESDRELWALHSEDFLADMREAMSQGVWGCGWDNVAWIGPWDFDPTEVGCPVLLWYGTEDRMALPSSARWFEANLKKPHLTMYEGEGHLLPFAHMEQMLKELFAH
jgi:pimeloyl-ACP methyl ester carboxylesterase